MMRLWLPGAILVLWALCALVGPSLVGDPNQLMQVFLSLIINAEQAIR